MRRNEGLAIHWRGFSLPVDRRFDKRTLGWEAGWRPVSRGDSHALPSFVFQRRRRGFFLLDNERSGL
jgi:hypothetical protein